MVIQGLKENKITGIIKNLLIRLKQLYDQDDINPKVFKLQSLGVILYSIELNGYSVIGTTRNNNFIKKIHIPYYKIDEDILNQIDSLLDEYKTFVSKKDSQLYSKINKLDLDSEGIDWNKIYNTKVYAKIFLLTSIDLLYQELENQL